MSVSDCIQDCSLCLFVDPTHLCKLLWMCVILCKCKFPVTVWICVSVCARCGALGTWHGVSAVLQQWGGAAVFLCPVLDPLSAWHNPTIQQIWALGCSLHRTSANSPCSLYVPRSLFQLPRFGRCQRLQWCCSILRKTGRWWKGAKICLSKQESRKKIRKSIGFKNTFGADVDLVSR